jgi:hypothetical protein
LGSLLDHPLYIDHYDVFINGTVTFSGGKTEIFLQTSGQIQSSILLIGWSESTILVSFPLHPSDMGSGVRWERPTSGSYVEHTGDDSKAPRSMVELL